FPLTDGKRLTKWIAAVGRTDWRPTKFSFLCSAHFTKDSFQKRQEDQHHRLKFNAVPSIFHLSENQKKVNGRRNHCLGAAKVQLAPVNQERTSSSKVLDDETTERLKPNFLTAGSELVLERTSVMDESGDTFQSSSAAVESVVYTVAERRCTLKSDGCQAPDTERLLIDGTVPFPDDTTPSASGARKLINSLHSYCLPPTHNAFRKDQVMKKNAKLKHLRQQSSRVVKRIKRLEGLIRKLQETNSTLVRCFLPQDHGSALTLPTPRGP
ncbi:hypothetical protein scyTo_0022469, partial [Scyliorhinus torazame]|nr:hypothetical protein [Scyliorhinus torazame]